MKAVAITAGGVKAEWFASWFDSEYYHKLYARRDEAEAAAFLDGLVRRLTAPSGAAVLDLACGAGRHSAYLSAKGFDVTGIDLSAASIARARARHAPNTQFVRQDMRESLGSDAYDYVFSLFTSLGYFDDPGENLTVLNNVATALKPRGTLVIDYLNVRHAELGLVPEEIVERDGTTFRISRWSDRMSFYKRIVVQSAHMDGAMQFQERVAKLTLADFSFMLALCGLEIEQRFGDYELSPFDVERSPRLILVARKMDGLGYLRDRFFRMRLNVSGVMPRYDASMPCGTLCTMEGYTRRNSR